MVLDKGLRDFHNKLAEEDYRILEWLMGKTRPEVITWVTVPGMWWKAMWCRTRSAPGALANGGISGAASVRWMLMLEPESAHSWFAVPLVRKS